MSKTHRKIIRIEHFGLPFIETQYARLLCTGIRHHLVVLLLI
jgi:hypothetical protein